MLRRLDAALEAWLTPWRCRVYPRTVAVMMGLVFAGSVAIGPGITDVSRTIVGADFSAFWIAGRMMDEGRSADLYDLAVQKRYLDALIAPVKNTSVHPYVNPPFFAAAMIPLSRLPYPGALALWWAIGLGVLLLTTRALHRGLIDPGRGTLRHSLSLPWLFFPTLVWFLNGQNSPFTLAILTGWVLALRRGRDVIAGLTVGLLLFKPQLGLAPTVIMLCTGRFRAIAAAAIPAALWMALGFLIGADAMRGYGRVAPMLFDFLRRPDYNSWGIISLFGFATTLCDDVSRRAGSALAFALTAVGTLAVAAAWWRQPWTPGSRTWDLRMAATLAIGLITAPHLYLYDAMLLLLPLALVIGQSPPADGRLIAPPRLRARTGLLYITLFVGPYLVRGLQIVIRGHGWPAPVPQPVTIAIVLWAAAVYAESRSGDAAVGRSKGDGQVNRRTARRSVSRGAFVGG